MRVLVTGASGNIGTSLLPLLSANPSVSSIVGLSRRRPRWKTADVDWVEADIAVDDLDDVVGKADAVVHLAWLIQPSRDDRKLWATNVAGTERLAAAVARAETPVFVAASSIGAYSPAPPGLIVDEGWPTDGVPESSYSWQKALTERTYALLDARSSTTRTVVMRPAVVFKRESARHIRNLFLGPFVPTRVLPTGALRSLLHRSPIPFQVVHADDVASAMVLALTTVDARGSFNLAAPGVVGHAGASAPAVTKVARLAVGASWRAHLIPTDPGWVSLADAVPVMSTARAEKVLGWQPDHDADDVLGELLDGLRQDASFPTPPLDEQRLCTAAVEVPASAAGTDHGGDQSVRPETLPI